MEEMNLEEMRNQFTILKEQLAKQEIISDHLLRKTMKSKNKEISFVKKYEFVGAILGLLIIVPLFIFYAHCSLAFIIATCLVLVTSLAGTYFIYKPIGKLNFMEDDLASVARVIAKFKKQKNNWEHFVSPACLFPWIAWAIYEFAWKNAPNTTFSWIVTLSGIIGAVIGLIIGIKTYRKVINAAQEILDDIEKN